MPQNVFPDVKALGCLPSRLSVLVTVMTKSVIVKQPQQQEFAASHTKDPADLVRDRGR